MTRPLEEPALIQLHGVNNDTVTISGTGAGLEGIFLKTDVEALFDAAPIKNLWSQSAYQEGATYLGTKIEPLDIVLPLCLDATDSGDFSYLYSRLLQLFDPSVPIGEKTKISVTVMGETRTLEVVLNATPKLQSSRDPNWLGYATVVLTLRAEWPFWLGETIEQAQDIGNNSYATFTVDNPTDVPIWPKFELGPGRWTIPQFGDIFLEPNGERRAKRFPFISPTVDGGNLTIDTYPRRPTYTHDNDTVNFAKTMKGQDFTAYIPPYTPARSYNISRNSGSGTSRVTVIVKQYWKRPFGGRKVI